MAVDAVTLGQFSLAALALVMSPGPDTMLILRYGLGGGQRIGMSAVLGVQAGLLGHLTLAVLGISVIVASSPLLFRGIAIAGAAYLGWLGIQNLRAAQTLGLGRAVADVTPAKAIRDAALCNLLNPKVILLFLALLPNFIDPGRADVTAQLVTLTAVLIIINVLWQAPIAWAADRVRPWLTQVRVQTIIARVTGGVFIGFAVLMLIQHLG